MNNNPIKATLLPYSEAHQTMVPLKNWMSGFEFKSCHNMHVAVASNDKGAILSMCYVKVDDSFLITAMEFNPKATVKEKREAGDGVDLLIEQQAQLAGVIRLLMVKPGGNECKEIRTYTPRITQVSALQPPSPVVYVN